MQASRKDLAYQCIIPYVEGHKLPEVHDMVKWVARSIVHYELWHYEPSKRLVGNDMGVE